MWWARLLNNVIGVLAPTTVLGGSYESIETFTVGAGGAASITFGSGGTIPQTYKHLQLRFLANMNNDINIRFNGDSSTAYSWHYVYGAGSTAIADRDFSRTFGYLAYGGFGGSTAFTAGITDILDYTSTNKNKTIKTLNGNDGNTTGGGVMLSSSQWYATPTAITSITLACNSGSANFGQHSTFALYGIKG
jgi:hypothetical protein